MSVTSTAVQEIVLNALATAAELPVSSLKRTTDVFDLGLDSMDFWTILMDVEDQTGADVPAEVLDRLAQFDSQVTVGDVLDAMAGWNPEIRPPLSSP